MGAAKTPAEIAASNGAPVAPANTPAPAPAPATTTTDIGIGTLTTIPKNPITTPATPSYTIKSGDTLSGIAAANKTTVADLLKANPSITNPDVIQAGAALNLPTASPDLSGAYTRTGITPPPATGPGSVDPSIGKAPAGWSQADYAAFKAANPTLEPTPEDTAKMLGLPTYGGGSSSTTDAANAEKAAYNQLQTDIAGLNDKIASAAVASPEEQALQAQLDAKKAELAKFDTATMQAEQNLQGQGRGATLGAINTETTVLDRTRALQRLGMAQDASTIATQLSTAQTNRQQQGALASTEYDLAMKKFDTALGIAKDMATLSDKQQSDARQYLLDVVNFAAGKTYDQLDATTQGAITNAVANSPITLDMVKTSLSSAADKAAATSAGNMYHVAGLGVVQVNPKDGSYKVVVPENPSTSPNANAPTFDQYVSNQNIALPSLTPEKLTQLRAEYDAKYPAGTTVSGTTADQIAEADQLLTFGVKSTDGSKQLYNGRGSDGYVDPNLYVAIYNSLDNAGKVQLLSKYPPAKNLNPKNIGASWLPTPVANALVAGQPTSSSSIQ